METTEEIYDIASRIRKSLKDSIDDFPKFEYRTAPFILRNKLSCLLVEGNYLGKIKPDLEIRSYESPNDIPGIPYLFSYNHDSGLFLDITSDKFSPENPDVFLIFENDPRLAFSRKEINNKTLYYINDIFLHTPRTEHRYSPNDLLPSRFIKAKNLAA